MNKGFTLAELLGVVTIIGVIALIVTVSVDKNIKNSRYQTCLVQEKNIKEAAKAWSVDNPDKLTDKVTLDIRELQKEGYLNEDLKNPMTNKKYSKTKIIITKQEDNYIYMISYSKKEKCSK